LKSTDLFEAVKSLVNVVLLYNP